MKSRIRSVVIGVGAWGLLVLSASTPVQAAEWCVKDPELVIAVSATRTITVYVTEGVLGSQNLGALDAAEISYSVDDGWSSKTAAVTVYDLIPNDGYGTFPVEMVVSSKPDGGGTVYGSAKGWSGTAMSVRFYVKSS